MPVHHRRALAVVVLAFAIASFFAFVPCAVSIIVASFVALLLRPWTSKLAAKLKDRTRAAAAITSAVVVAAAIPLAIAITPIAIAAAHLPKQLQHAQHWKDAAETIVGKANGASIASLAREQLSQGSSKLVSILGASANVVFGVAMFVVGLYALLAHGDALALWMRSHSPLARRHFDRLATTYERTGRGLVIGVGTTALVQGVLAGITFTVVGLPVSFALGLLTTVFALVPGVGTMIVWGPITVILALGGYTTKAIIVGVSGVVLIGSVDNFLKPILSARGSLPLPSILVFITMLSGVAAFGASGLLLAPLVVCLAKEGLAIARDERMVGQRQTIVRP